MRINNLIIVINTSNSPSMIGQQLTQFVSTLKARMSSEGVDSLPDFITEINNFAGILDY